MPIPAKVIVGGEHHKTLSGSQLTKWRSSHIGFIFQFYNLMPMLSAASNIELPLLLTNLSKSERQRQVEDRAGGVSLKDRAGHKPGEMSGGQQQPHGHCARHRRRSRFPALRPGRPAIWTGPRRMAFSPCCSKLNRQHKKTILMVTHDPKAADHASRQLEMDKGSLIEPALVAAQ